MSADLAFDCGTDTLPDTQQIRTPSLMCRLRMHTPAKAEKSLHIHLYGARDPGGNRDPG